MNESNKSRTRSSSKEGRPTVTFGAPLSTSEERKLFQAQTYFELSLKNLSSPFPQQDLISADSAEDIFVVQLPTSIVELQKAILEGSASADETLPPQVTTTTTVVEQFDVEIGLIWSQIGDNTIEVSLPG